MWLVPGAQLIEVPNRSAGVRDKTLGLILHVQVGNNVLAGWFSNPSSGASSTWQTLKSGKNIQFGDPDKFRFWTQGAGNTDYASVETEGYPHEPLTPEQIEGVAQIYAAGHCHEGWPFVLAEKPGDPGLGWHGMGGREWGGHYDCPGVVRKAQRQQILDRAKQIAGEAPEKEWDDMASKEEIRALIREEVEAAFKADVIPSPKHPAFKDNPTITRDTALRFGPQWALQASDRVAQLAAILSPDAISRAVKAALPDGSNINVDELAKRIVINLGKE